MLIRRSPDLDLKIERLSSVVHISFNVLTDRLYF